MSRTFDLNDTLERAQGLRAAAQAVRAGELVVLPTDTVYGVGCDAFDHQAVGKLLAAKGRGRDMPVPVLVSGPRALDGIAFGLTSTARDLVEAFWPGALTLICTAQPTLDWDLGTTNGTVAVRMPLHPAALELLTETGPMGVSSANESGKPAAPRVEDAMAQLGGLIEVYLDGGPVADPVPSTILDVSGLKVKVVRLGALSIEQLRDVAPGIDAPAAEVWR